MSFEIEDNVELTAKAGGGGQGTIYPFADLKVGQSFLVPVEIDKSAKTADARRASFAENARKVSNRLNGAKGRFAKKHPEVNIALRTIAPGTTDSDGEPMLAGVRVYRVTDHGTAPKVARAAPRKAPPKAKAPKSKQAKPKAPAKPKAAPKAAPAPDVPTIPV